MRAREFVMKDAYSVRHERRGAVKSYLDEGRLHGVFRRAGVKTIAVEAIYRA